jgi:hypothetical protein
VPSRRRVDLIINDEHVCTALILSDIDMLEKFVEGAEKFMYLLRFCMHAVLAVLCH